jgi:hypothetical protein
MLLEPYHSRFERASLRCFGLPFDAATKVMQCFGYKHIASYGGFVADIKQVYLKENANGTIVETLLGDQSFTCTS